MHNFVAFDLAIGVDEDNAILVALNLVVLDKQVSLALDDENALSALRVEDIVVHDASLACFLTSKSNIGLNVVFNFVRDNLARATLDDQNSLVIVTLDNVCVGKTLDMIVGCHMNLVVVEL